MNLAVHFHPGFSNQFLCVYNDGNAAGVDDDGKPFKAQKANDIRLWQNPKKVKKFAEKHPELGVLRMTMIVTTQVIDMEDFDAPAVGSSARREGLGHSLLRR